MNNSERRISSMPSKRGLWVIAAPVTPGEEGPDEETQELEFTDEQQEAIRDAIDRARESGLSDEAVVDAQALIPLVVQQRMTPGGGKPQRNFQEALDSVVQFLAETAKEASNDQIRKIRNELPQINATINSTLAHNMKVMMGLDVQLESMADRAGSFKTLMKGGVGRKEALGDMKTFLREHGLENIDPAHRAQTLQYYVDKQPFYAHAYEKKNKKMEFVGTLKVDWTKPKSTKISEIIDDMRKIMIIESAIGGELENANDTVLKINQGLDKILANLNKIVQYVSLVGPKFQPLEAKPYEMGTIEERGQLRKDIALKPPTTAAAIISIAVETLEAEAPATVVADVPQEIIDETKILLDDLDVNDSELMKSLDRWEELENKEDEIFRDLGLNATETSGGAEA